MEVVRDELGGVGEGVGVGSPGGSEEEEGGAVPGEGGVLEVEVGEGAPCVEGVSAGEGDARVCGVDAEALLGVARAVSGVGDGEDLEGALALSFEEVRVGAEDEACEAVSCVVLGGCVEEGAGGVEVSEEDEGDGGFVKLVVAEVGGEGLREGDASFEQPAVQAGGDESPEVGGVLGEVVGEEAEGVLGVLG